MRGRVAQDGRPGGSAAAAAAARWQQAEGQTCRFKNSLTSTATAAWIVGGGLSRSSRRSPYPAAFWRRSSVSLHVVPGPRRETGTSSAGRHGGHRSQETALAHTPADAGQEVVVRRRQLQCGHGARQ